VGVLSHSAAIAGRITSNRGATDRSAASFTGKTQREGERDAVGVGGGLAGAAGGRGALPGATGAGADVGTAV
jgi:hypothetical protein